MLSRTVLRVNAGWYRFSIDAPSHLSGVVKATFDGLEHDGPVEHHWTLGVREELHDELVEIAVDDRPERWTRPTDELPRNLVSALNSAAHFGVVDRLHLHCGAVRLRGDAVLIAGPSGAGKSIAVCALAARGAGYLSDESVAVLRDGAIEALRKPVSVKPSGRGIVGQLVGNYAFVDSGGWATLAPASVGVVAPQDPVSVGTVVRYRHDHSRNGSLERLHPADALCDLLGGSINIRDVTKDAIWAVADMVAGARCFDFSGSSPDRILNVLEAGVHNEQLRVPVEVLGSPTAGVTPSRHGLSTSVVIDDRAVVVAPDRSEVLSLDAASSVWWRLLDGTPLSDSVADVASAADLPVSDIAASARLAVESFVARGLIA